MVKTRSKKQKTIPQGRGPATPSTLKKILENSLKRTLDKRGTEQIEPVYTECLSPNCITLLNIWLERGDASSFLVHVYLSLEWINTRKGRLLLAEEYSHGLKGILRLNGIHGFLPLGENMLDTILLLEGTLASEKIAVESSGEAVRAVITAREELIGVKPPHDKPRDWLMNLILEYLAAKAVEDAIHLPNREIPFPRSLDQICEELKKKTFSKIARTTCYRRLSKLAEAGYVEHLEGRKGYRLRLDTGYAYAILYMINPRAWCVLRPLFGPGMKWKQLLEYGPCSMGID